MTQALDGEQAAYADLLALLATVARGYARARLGSVPFLDDVVQDTLLSVHVSRHTYDRQRPFAPWFYAILKSRLVDAVRRHRRIAVRETVDELAREPASQPAGDAGVDVEAIRRALGQLPGRQREIIERLKYRDESVRDIARRLGLTESAVKVTAHRGYRTLRRLLGGKE